MPELPLDVWLHVTSFLRKEDIVNLYGTNSLLSNIALDQRYRDLEIGLDVLKTSPHLEAFSKISYDQFTRVRRLSLTVESDNLLDFVPIKKPPRWAAALLNAVTKPAGSDPEAAMRKIINQLSNVSWLRVSHSEESSSLWESFGLPLVFEAFKTCSNRLQHLRLDGNLDFLSAVLKDSPTFPSLEYLEMRFFTSPARDGVDLTCSQPDGVLLSFINRHARTLRSLRFEFLGLRYDPSPMFANFAHMASLQSFVCHITDLSNPNPIYDFLQRHSSNLCSLEFLLPYSFTTDPQTLLGGFNFPLPSLQELKIDWRRGLRRDFLESNVFNPAAMCLIKNYSPSLVTLDLGQYMLTINELVEILDYLTSSSKLKNLRLGIISFTAESLDLLSTKTPHLEDLSIKTLDFKASSKSGFHIIQPFEFCNEVTKRCYIHWDLRYLTLSLVHELPKDIECCCAAVAVALPRLLVLNGSPRSQHLKGEAGALMSQWV